MGSRVSLWRSALAASIASLTLVTGALSSPPIIPHRFGIHEAIPALVGDAAPATQPSAAASSTGRYIVGLRGATAVQAAKAADARAKTPDPARLKAHIEKLQSEQHDFLRTASKALGRALQPGPQFQHAFNGMLLTLNAAEAQRLRSQSGVASVEPEVLLGLSTDMSTSVIGAPKVWDGSSVPSGVGTRGEGVVIALIDTGLNLASPSFASVDSGGYQHVNPLGQGNYLGWCDPAHPQHVPARDVCNDKVIGGWDFVDATMGGVQNAYEAPGFEDENGHGSLAASAAAGNQRNAAYAGGDIETKLSGVAPRASLVIYDACYTDLATGRPQCPSGAVLAALNQVLADDVADVLLYSPEGGQQPWSGANSQALLALHDAGVLTVAAAGNGGPAPGSVQHNEPWVLTVGASNNGRTYGFRFDLTGPPNPPANTKNIALRAGTPLPPASISGNLVISPSFADAGKDGCDAFQNQHEFRVPKQAQGVQAIAVLQLDASSSACSAAVRSAHAFAAGAKAVIFIDDAPLDLDVGDFNYSMLSADWQPVSAHIALNPAQASASIVAPIQYIGQAATELAASSGRGPGLPTVMKPDLVAPGVDILGADSRWSFSLVGLPFGGQAEASLNAATQMRHGSSIAAAHAAGGAALLIALHPDWTPMEVKSALASTAVSALTEADGSATDVFDRGSGLLEMTSAVRGGLVLDETGADFQAADPAQLGNPATLNLPSVLDLNCTNNCTMQRTLRSVAGNGQTVKWNVTVAPNDTALGIDTGGFELSAGQTTTITFTGYAGALPQNTVKHYTVFLTPDVPPFTSTVIPVALRRAAQNPPLFDKPAYAFSVEEPVPSGTTVGTPVGTVHATDIDPGDQVASYQITAGNTGNAFAIGQTGNITVLTPAALSPENPPFVLEVTATDNTARTATVEVQVTVLDFDEFPQFTFDPYAFSVQANAPSPTLVGTVHADDPEGTAVGNYFLLDGNTDGAFVIDPNNGEIRVSNQNAIKTANSPFVMTVLAQDEGGRIGSTVVKIWVLDPVFSPVFQGDPFQFIVQPGEALGVKVGTATANDPQGPPIAFAIIDGDPLDAFDVNGVGEIRVKTPGEIKIENSPFQLVLEVSDPQGNKDGANVTILVQNQPPVFNDDPPYQFVIGQGAPEGTGAGVISAQDSAIDTLTFEITGGNTGNAFKLFQPFPKTMAVLADESAAISPANSPFQLEVTVTDPGGLTDVTTVQVTVTPDPAPQFPTDMYVFNVDENSGPGTSVGLAQATDASPYFDQLQYAIIEGNTNNAFFISGGGQITVSQSSEMIAGTTFVLTVRVTDSYGQSDTATVVVNVIDLPQAPAWVGEPYSFNVNLPTNNGALVGVISAIDPDVNDEVTYAIINGNPNNAFSLNPQNGQIKINDNAALADFPVYNLAITATDNSPLHLAAPLGQVQIHVVPTEDAYPPSWVGDPFVFHIAAQPPIGAEIGTVAATDLDYNPTDPNEPRPGAVRYRLINGSIPIDSVLFGGYGGEILAFKPQHFVIANSPINFIIEGTDSYELTLTGPIPNEPGESTPVPNEAKRIPLRPPVPLPVGLSGPLVRSPLFGDQVGDGCNPYLNQNWFRVPKAPNGMSAVAVLRVNPNTPGCDDSIRLLNATNAGASTIIFVHDSYIDTIYGYSMLMADWNSIQAHLDLPEYNQNQDSASVQIKAGITIATNVQVIVDGNAPSFAQNSYNFEVPLLAPVNHEVGQVNATDADVGDQITYSIVGGDPESAFAINGGSGQITVLKPEEMLLSKLYNLTVRATDLQGLSDDVPVTVTVLNTPVAPQFLGEPYVYITAPSPAQGEFIGAVDATDANPDSVLSFSITGGNTGNAFQIDPASGIVTVATPAAVTLQNPQFNLTVRVSDGALIDQTNVQILVQDPTAAPEFDSDPYATSVQEQTGAGASVIAVGANDPNGDELDLVYEIIGGNEVGAFSMDPFATIRVAQPSFVTVDNSPFVLTVKVTDPEGLIDIAKVWIAVEAVGQSPTFIGDPYAFMVSTGAAPGVSVGTVEAIDPNDGALAYSIVDGDPGDLFEIDSDSGEITVPDPSLLSSDDSPVSFVVQVTDLDEQLVDVASVQVTVVDPQAAPQFTGEPYLFFVEPSPSPNAEFGDPVGDLNAEGPDPNILFALLGGTPSNPFFIDAGSGGIGVFIPGELVAGTLFTLDASVTDSQGQSDSTDVTVVVHDPVNSPNFIGEPYAFSVAPLAPMDTLVGDTTAEDPNGLALQYEIFNGNIGGAFKIDAGGTISVAKPDAVLEANSPFQLLVTASNGTLIDATVVSITVQAAPCEGQGGDSDGDDLCNETDPDDDGDGLPDDVDPCPLDPQNQCVPPPDCDAQGGDTDGDNICNQTDPDDDNDGLPDGEDPCPLDSQNQCAPPPDCDAQGGDTDGDNICNETDPDDDGDGLPDGADPCPLDPQNQCVPPPDCDAQGGDTDGDNICNETDPDDDGDGLPDGADPCPLDSQNQCVPPPDCDAQGGDTDGDNICNETDPDDDGDGLPDGADPCPLDSQNQCVPPPDCDAQGGDTDGDNICNETDPDDDGDGLPDGADPCPLDSQNQCVPPPDCDAQGGDTDGDNICNETDPDDDGDGLPDGADPCPLDPQNQCIPPPDCSAQGGDTDGDNICNDDDVDDDNDGLPDGADPCPLDSQNQCIPPPDCSALGGDDDGDNICNDNDVDDDGDGLPDGVDPCPLDPMNGCIPPPDCSALGGDTDGDNICNATDPDDDNDGTPDGADPCPLDPQDQCGGPQAPAFSSDAYVFGVSVLAPVGRLVGQVAAPDPEQGAVTYSIEPGPFAAAYSIEAQTGIIRVAVSDGLTLNNSPQSITVRATDEQGLFDTAAVTIEVLPYPIFRDGFEN